MSLHHKAHPHGLAARAGLKHIGAYVLHTLLQLLLRLIALAPVIYASATGQFFGVPKAHLTGISLLCSLPLYLLLVLPLRHPLGQMLSTWTGAPVPAAERGSYPVWLSQSLGRLLRILPFLIPLMAWLGVFYYYANIAPTNYAWLDLTSLGGLFGGDIIAGMAVLLVLLAVSLWLAAIGWRRIMPFFYLGIRPLKEDARRMANIDKRQLKRSIRLNALITLPAIAALLLSSLLGDLSGNLLFDATTILGRMLAFDPGILNLRTTGPLLAVIYLPFVLWRKLALVVVIHRDEA